MEVLPDVLKPDLELLRKEYVLVQAWKKTSNYIRYHNWYADTLELDWITVNLPEFLAEIAECLESPNDWVSDPLRLVPAPKSQRWHIKKEDWQPESRTNETRLRPLAHVSPRDQVIATALMLCIADRIETRQGDPRRPHDDPNNRRRVSSYGNRLFCDSEKDQLRHRWGSSKLYRAYFQDYRSFIARPGVVAESIQESGRHVYVIESDLSQFYDRVRPEDLLRALRKFQFHEEEQTFFDFAERILDWRWDHRDSRDVRAYAAAAQLEDFHRIALPQGLVSAGFFANVLLIPFDERLRDSTAKEVIPGIRLEDACRYVDDLRLVVSTRQTQPDLKDAVYEWLETLLTAESPGLSISYDKTHAGEFGGSQRPFLRQSRRMERIQTAISGGFDAIAGAAILEAVQGLVRSQEAWRDSAGEWDFSPLPDVRDETVARFAAARFRTTYRSIRPLLEAREVVDRSSKIGHEGTDNAYDLPGARTQLEHDDDAQAFSLWLIERWIADPSNVRLLRIGFDIWPDSQVLEAVLTLLRPFTQPGGPRKLQRRVALYCFSELLRAGATETGFVSDKECLSEDIDLQKYRDTLRDEAVRLVGLPSSTVPWYLRQQSLLFLAAFDPTSAPIARAGRNPETMRYRRLILFLRGEQRRLPDADFATLTVLQRRSFVRNSKELKTSPMSVGRRMEIAIRDPSFAVELSRSNPSFFDGLPEWLREDACIVSRPKRQELPTLARVVLDDGSKNPLRNELSLLRFAEAFVNRLSQSELASMERVSPGQVQLKLQPDPWVDELLEMEMSKSEGGSASSFYAVPKWCAPVDRWRFQLGFLLRFILAARPDFTLAVRRQAWLSKAYRPCKSHWYQRVYGLFNGQEAFGDDWLPITDWMEQFLLALLRWPGCRLPAGFEWVHRGAPCALSKIQNRIRFLRDKRGPATGLLMLPMVAGRPDSDTSPRPLRVCVVQTIIPDKIEPKDLTFSAPDIRRRHRNHLSAALQAVRRMLDLRYTHEEGPKRLDWLILPEFATHPDDVRTHLGPFARQHKTLILTGLTYEQLLLGEPLINSALWIMPEVTRDQGLRIRTRRQGKKYLAPEERPFNTQGFRPCQWLIGYPWAKEHPPLWLTGSICYDATDLRLASDLRTRSDVFAIPALNKDVRTFDQMALALHYHMFQLVIIANNGTFGGSNSYWPIRDIHKRRIFHLHGQPQASIAFLDIDVGDLQGRVQGSAKPVHKNPDEGWKHPPAGLQEE